ncbi:MAG: helix-turn-helix transcriptional regulator, partial [Bacteroidaceae bacterium]
IRHTAESILNSSNSRYLELTTRYRDSLAVLDRGGDIAHMEKDRFLSQNAQIRHRYKTFIRLGILILSGCGIILTLVLKRKRHRERGHWDELKRQMKLQQQEIQDLRTQLEMADAQEMQGHALQEKQVRLHSILDDFRKNIQTTGRMSASQFIRTKVYSSLKRNLNNLKENQREEYVQLINLQFKEYAALLTTFIHFSKEDVLLCCLLLSHFSSKEIAALRCVSEGTVRTRKSRIKERLNTFFVSDDAFDSLFRE